MHILPPADAAQTRITTKQHSSRLPLASNSGANKRAAHGHIPIHDCANSAGKGQYRSTRRQTHTIAIVDVLDDGLVEQFWDLYQITFEPLRTRAIARQVLYRDEFVAEMRDPRVSKLLATDRHGRAIGLTIFTKHLETVPWISPEYFAARYPTYAERGAIYYLGFSLVLASHRHTTAFIDMLSEVTFILSTARAICGYDICTYNEKLHFDRCIKVALRGLPSMAIDQLDAQTYFCLHP